MGTRALLRGKPPLMTAPQQQQQHPQHNSSGRGVARQRAAAAAGVQAQQAVQEMRMQSPGMKHWTPAAAAAVLRHCGSVLKARCGQQRSWALR